MCFCSYIDWNTANSIFLWQRRSITKRRNLSNFNHGGEEGILRSSDWIKKLLAPRRNRFNFLERRIPCFRRLFSVKLRNSIFNVCTNSIKKSGKLCSILFGGILKFGFYRSFAWFILLISWVFLIRVHKFGSHQVSARCTGDQNLQKTLAKLLYTKNNHSGFSVFTDL